MKEAAVEIKIPEEAIDPLAKVTLERWNNAVRARNTELVTGRPVSQVLVDCYQQREGVLCDEDRAVAKELGIELSVNISGLKVSALVAWMRDLLLNTGELPFDISPTPISELSHKARLQVLDRVKEELFGDAMFDGDLIGMIKAIKSRQIELENARASTACDNMTKLIQNQCDMGGFRESLLQFINDFATYPFAVMHGPIPTAVDRMVWSGDKLVPKSVVEFQWRPCSVFDFFWTPDSRDAQTGVGVFVRERLTRQQLFNCTNMKSYIKENVFEVLDDLTSGTLPLTWTSATNPEQPTKLPFSTFSDNDTVEALRHYGLFLGRDLIKYGISVVDERQQYEATVIVIGNKTIYATVNPNPSVITRPVYTASFEKIADRIPGVGICQKVRGVERAYHSALRHLLLNSAYAAGPIAEVDYSRIKSYVKPEDLGMFDPFTVYPTTTDAFGGNKPAYTFHHIAGNMGAYMQMTQYFMDLADRITQIPASLHGEPVGTGANRTFRGMAMLYGNAIKPIQSAIANMDVGVFKPCGELLYNYNMVYHDDDSVKGNARVIARGATGLISKEIAKQNAFETLQVVAQAGASAPDMVNPAVMQWAVNQLLSASGVPIDELERVDAASRRVNDVTPDGMVGDDNLLGGIMGNGAQLPQQGDLM